MKPYRVDLSRCSSILCAALMFVVAGDLQAHALGQSYVFFRIQDETIDGRVEMTMADLNTALGLELPEDHSATLEQVAPYVDTIEAYLLERIFIDSEEGSRPLRLQDPHILDTRLAQYLVFDFVLDVFEKTAEYLDMRFSVLHDVASEHQNIVILENEWRSGTFNQEANIVLIFGADDVEHRLELTSSSVWRGVWLLTNLGIHHISIGIDHILFLMALLLPSVLYRKQL